MKEQYPFYDDTGDSILVDKHKHERLVNDADRGPKREKELNQAAVIFFRSKIQGVERKYGDDGYWHKDYEREYGYSRIEIYTKDEALIEMIEKSSELLENMSKMKRENESLSEDLKAQTKEVNALTEQCGELTILAQRPYYKRRFWGLFYTPSKTQQ